MLNDNKSSDSKKSFLSSFPLLASLGTFLIAVATVLLHLIGDVVHRKYLSFWGINHELFPKKVDWILINGYYGFVNGLFEIVNAVFNNALYIISFALILVLYIYILEMPILRSKNETPAWLEGKPNWVRRFIKAVLLSVLISTIFPLVFFLLTLFLVIPAAVAESIGRNIAEKELIEYKKGCQKAKYICVEMKRDGGAEAIRGFLLDVSPSHIAIFSPESMSSHVIPLIGATFDAKPKK
ncbi:hypothetical protein [Delftia acidovorans]